MSDSIPSELRYTKDHEWARAEGDVIVVGITAHAVEQLGDITMLSLPEVGASVTAGEVFGDIDSVKATSDLFAPLDGAVTEVNGDLDAAPEKVNEDPYGNGWMIKIKPADKGAFDELLSADAYAELVAAG